MRLLRTLPLALLLALAACASNSYFSRELILARQQALNGMLGESCIRVIRSLGEPKTVHPDGEGGQILMWEQRDKHGLAQVFVFVNSESKVYFWRAQDPSGLYAPNLTPEAMFKE